MKSYLILIIAALLYGYMAQAQPQVSLTKDEIHATLQKPANCCKANTYSPTSPSRCSKP
ncbi:MAG: hypothetical protein IPN33_23450 [Saprospiraceae bacterium]|nr:hypothetical protein [Saprospiraceae bacterium]